MRFWLINPYGPIPSESWRDYSFSMMGEALAVAGHDVVWWTSNFSHHFKKFRSKSWKDILIREKFVIRLVPTSGYKKNIGIGRIMRDAIFAYRTYKRGKKIQPPDCILYSESPLNFGYAGQKLAQFHGIPVVFDQMDLWPELFEAAVPRPIRPLLHFALIPVYYCRISVYKKLNAAIALAKAYLEIILEEAPILRQRSHDFFYNGIDVKKFRANMAAHLKNDYPWPIKKKGEIWCVFAGSLGPSYDILNIIEVAHRLNKFDDNNLRFIVAGDGPLCEKVQACMRDSSGSCLFYVGKLRPIELCHLYDSCDIGLCTYTSNSNVEMPDKIYDYTAAGLAVVNSLKGEVAEVIRKNKIGLQYFPGSADSLLETLRKLASNKALREEMSRNSFNIAHEFDGHVQYGRLVSFLENVCAK